MTMRNTGRALAWLTIVLSLGSPAFAADYYVAPDGSDDASGTEDAPFATAQRGQQAASPGDTVFFRGGTYAFSGNSDIGVLFDKSGQDGARINYFAYPGEVPIFDFNDLTPQARIRGFSVRASWLHFRGLELTGVQQILVDQNESWCIRVENGASNNVFELLNLHHNEGPGLFIQDGGNNLVLNVDSHHNYDPDRGGENADGFGCHSDDPGNVFRDCRAWYNSDDGFDFINSPGVCTVEGSWAFWNGFVPDSRNAAGNGAGIKAGGFTSNVPQTIPRHVVRFNLAFGNRAQGFYANHHEGGIDWVNNTAFGNPRNFDMLADEGRAEHYLRNNLAAGSGEGLARATASEIDDSHNSWSLDVSVAEDDFVSTSDSGVDGPRQSDGSMPNIGFMRLAEGSDLIDAGQDEGSAFNGAAPDLGAFEFGDAPAEVDEPDDAGGQGGTGTADPDLDPDSDNQGDDPDVGAGGADGSGEAMGIDGSAGGAGGTNQDTPPDDASDPSPNADDAADPSDTDDSNVSDDVTNETPTAAPSTTDSTQSPGAPAADGSGDSSPATTTSPAADGEVAPPSVESADEADDSGCSCRIGARPTTNSGVWVALLFVALSRRRRD